LSQLREPAARWFHTEHADVDSGTHIVEKNLTLARHLNVEVGEWEFPLEVPPSAVVAETRRRLAPGDGNSFVVLNPGTAWQSKCWDPSRYGEVASRLHADYGMRSVVSWGPGEELLAERVVSGSNGAAVTAPPTTLPDLVTLLDAAAGVVAGDTGPLHLAAAVGTPVVGVYGPSDPARNGPWDAADEVVSSFADCRCRHDIARSATGGVVVRACHEAERCLDDVSVDDVVDAVTRRLGLPIAHA
jgi:ADP-heptose:LPS heptosyltransferase